MKSKLRFTLDEISSPDIDKEAVAERLRHIFQKDEFFNSNIDINKLDRYMDDIVALIAKTLIG